MVSAVNGTAARATVLILLYVGLAVLPLALAYAYAPTSYAPPVVDAALAAGLLGFSLLAMQAAMGARLHILDRAFGLDVVMLFHRGMGVFAMLLLLAHPILLAVGFQSMRLFGFATSWQVNLGKAALLLLVAGVALALGFSRLRIDYNLWRLFHKLMIVVLMLGFLHSMYIGPSLTRRGMAVYWTAVFSVAVLLFLWQNLYIELYGRRRFAVTAVTPETHDTFTIEMKPRDGDIFEYRPGQFMFLTFGSAGVSAEEHPFTISSTPTNTGDITATIKQSGDFTNHISDVKAGDLAHIQGPFGRYSLTFSHADSFVFIAGGVGITPIRSMIAFLRDTGDARPVTLIYGNKTERDIIFRSELDSLPKHMKVHHILSSPAAAWSGLRGFVTADTVKSLVPEQLASAAFYVCGPPPMMDAIIRGLRSLGVPARRIYMERFTI